MEPNVEVKVEILPWGGRREKMLTAYAGGENPDMALMQNDMLSLMGINGVLTPLGDLISQERLDEIPERIVEGISWGDSMIFMPFCLLHRHIPVEQGPRQRGGLAVRGTAKDLG